jgi:hypothetical protein
MTTQTGLRSLFVSALIEGGVLPALFRSLAVDEASALPCLPIAMNAPVSRTHLAVGKHSPGVNEKRPA